MRQRLHARSSLLATLVGRALTVLLGAALVWYGAMVMLLALNLSPATVNSLSGYRDAFDYLAGLTPADIGGRTRLLTALAGLLATLIFGWLTWRQLPLPHFARSAARLDHGPRGTTAVAARAIERAAEVAAAQHPGVADVRARVADDRLVLDVTACDAGTVADTLREVRDRAHQSIDDHDLDARPVDVTLAGLERDNGRVLR